MPVVVNAHGRKPNEIGPNEVYIGRATRNGDWAGTPRSTANDAVAPVISAAARRLPLNHFSGRKAQFADSSFFE